MPIANGETAGVLVEVDMQRVREQGAERQATEKQKRRERLAVAVARLLEQHRPLSVRSVADRLAAHDPPLFVKPGGEPLGYESVRKKLLAEIGEGGLPAPGTPPRVRDEPWAASGLSPNGGMLCLNCLERRMRRKLRLRDFTAIVPAAYPVPKAVARAYEAAWIETFYARALERFIAERQAAGAGLS